MSGMTSNKPYMIRAIHEWIIDNGCTPYIVFMADYPGVQVPQDFVSDGQITLNIALSAVRDLSITNEAVTFSARFGGIPTDIVGPIGSVAAVFAKENGQGMGFEVDFPAEEDAAEAEKDQDKSGAKRPSLKVVK